MFDFTESVEIETTADRLWSYLIDIESWWPTSNPEHESLEILSYDKHLAVGTRLRIRERIAGIPGEAEGEITELVEADHVSWEADRARYRLWGIPLEVAEGVRWTLRPGTYGIHLAATVWARFPGGWKGRLVEWLFKRPLDGVRKDREHTRRELEHIKAQLEQAP